MSERVRKVDPGLRLRVLLAWSDLGDDAPKHKSAFFKSGLKWPTQSVIAYLSLPPEPYTMGREVCDVLPADPIPEDKELLPKSAP